MVNTPRLPKKICLFRRGIFGLGYTNCMHGEERKWIGQLRC
jgi:hypothetical protein